MALGIQCSAAITTISSLPKQQLKATVSISPNLRSDMPLFCYVLFLGSKSPTLVHMHGKEIIQAKDARRWASLM